MQKQLGKVNMPSTTNMTNNWKKYKLSDVAEIIDSLHQTPKYSPIGHPMVRVTDIKGGYLKLEECLKVDTEIFNEFSKKHKPKKGDIVMSRVGSCGISSLVTDDTNFCLGQNTLFIIPKTASDFIYYFLNSKYGKEQLETLSTGSTQKTVSLASIKGIEITLPPLPEQQAIAEILSSLDDKIELNLQTNKTLEEMANTLYKHWFVDFGPFKNGKFIESELGLIPEGWEVKNLSSIVDVRDGTHDSPKRVDLGKYLITSKHIKDNEIDFNGAYFISEFDFDQINKRSKVNTGDIFITMIGTVGNVYLVKEDVINYAIKNVGLIRTSEVSELQEFLYLFFKSPIGKEFIETRKTGSTQQYISLSELRKFPLIMPNENIVEKFSLHVKDYFNQIQNNIKENTFFKQTRDYLLPKLISGQIRVKDAQKLAKEVL